MQRITDRYRNQFLPTSLRASIIAASYWVLSLSLTGLSGSVASFLGCLFGCYLIDATIHRSPLKFYRSTTIIFTCALIGVCGVLLSSVVTGSLALANILSPLISYHSAEFIKWLAVSSALTISLRMLAYRSSFGAVLEILFVASAFVITLAAHRNGMIHRPYFIGDFGLMRGIDPAAILLVLGCGAVLCLSALLMIESNQRRLPYHFVVLGLLCSSLLFYVQFFGLPTPNYTDELGLTGQEQNRNDNDNPFRDGENNAENLEAPVAIVLFRDDYEPLNGSYYFRETAYSQWNGKVLDEAVRNDMDQDLLGNFPSSRTEISDAIPSTEARSEVRTSVGMLIPHRTPFGLETPVVFEHTANPNNLRFKRTYDVISMAPMHDFEDLLEREIGAPDWSAEVWQEYLALPPDPRYGELAQNLINGLRPEYADDPFARAYAIKSYLDENGIYSLKNAHSYSADPAASFLFGDLTGYCMHFAFSATYMFRSMGIPARVGIGYSVPASNRAGGSALLIQAIHGHAWPEVYFRDLGWVVIDPAPQQTLVDMSTDPQNNLQQLLGDMLRNDASFEEFMTAQQGFNFPLSALLNTLYILLLLLLIGSYSVKFYRQWIPLRAAQSELYRVSYRAVLDQLAARGLHRREGESREAFAHRVSELTPSFSRMTEQHLQRALGIRKADNDQAFNWQASSREINQELHHSEPFWKNLLAILHPYSWLMIN
jgi:protein-glutamine gamma-glutamyltransferase